jgi:multidrug efflux pump
MNFTDLFIKRPVLALVVSALILLLGLQATRLLPVSEYPMVEESVITVTAVYPGASAKTVQGFVTTPLQQRIAGAQGVDYITSDSAPGVSTITVHVRLGFDANAALTQVIAKVNEAKGDIPQAVLAPVVSTGSPGDALMYIGFYSNELSIEQVTDYLMRVVQPELATIEGVGTADLGGAKYFAMRVWLDPARMAEFGVTAEEVRDAISRNNYISAAGDTQGELVMASVNAETDLRNPEQFGEMVVRHQGDERVRLQDVAELELSSEDNEVFVTSSGREAVFVDVQTAPGANPLEVAKRIHDRMPAIVAKLPGDMTGFVDFDAAVFIQEAIKEVVQTLLEAALIVVLVIFLFLGSIRVVVIPLVAIPLSLIGVLFLMYIAGFSINLLTLLALVLAIGLVVDDAIVVVENVHRFIEEGDTPFDAALKGAREVALPVIAMTLTLAAVYAPIGFLGGLTGTLFSEFAFTLAGAVVVSGVIALTLSPMMCAHMLTDHGHQGKLANWMDQRFEQLRCHYHRLLSVTLDNRGPVALFCTCIIASLAVLFGLMRSELAPEEDQGVIFLVADKPQATNLEYYNRFTAPYEDIFNSIAGYGRSFLFNTPSSSFGGVVLKPWDERESNQQEIQKQLQGQLSSIAGTNVYTFSPASLPGSGSGLPVQFVIAGTGNYEAVYGVAEEVVQAARRSGLFAFVDNGLKFNRPEITVSIDRAKASRLGISMKSIGDTLSVMLGEGELNRFSMDGRSYKVIPQAGRNFRLSKEWLERYYLRTETGELIPMSTVIELGRNIEPNKLKQYQQLNSATIQGMLAPGISLGEALSFLTEKTNTIAPPGFRVGYEGESRQFIQEGSSLMSLFGVSVLAIFLVLAAQFNSLRDPVVILLSVPMSVFGASIPLVLGMATLNIYTQVGLLTLIGLITKHGILIVEFANERLRQGLEAREAVLEAASLRLRPVLMTTAATVLGVVPLLIAVGAGANSRFSIGLVIAWGMIVGTVFTLFVVPVFYLVMHHPKKTQSESKGLNVEAGLQD